MGGTEGSLFDANHRMLRTIEGFSALRNYFHLGVNFIETLVNRHRIELYIVDTHGRVSACFERLHWDESEVVARVKQILSKDTGDAKAPKGAGRAPFTILAALASVGWAFFPKCPICWTAYLSTFGIAGISQIPYPSKMGPVLAAMMLFGVFSVWLRARATRQMSAFYLVCIGTLLIVLSKAAAAWHVPATLGVVLTFIGTLWSSLNGKLPASTWMRKVTKEPNSHGIPAP